MLKFMLSLTSKSLEDFDQGKQRIENTNPTITWERLPEWSSLRKQQVYLYAREILHCNRIHVFVVKEILISHQ